jgi:ribosomal-protein-alanine N-acetyltransferase
MHNDFPQIETPRTIMTIGQPMHAQALLDFMWENRAHLEPWEPLRSDNFYTLDATRERLDHSALCYRDGTALQFLAFDKTSNELVATCNFANIVHRAFQACHLGYSISEKWQGQGLMLEVVEAGIRHVFEVVDLHRVMANHMPSNVRSERLLQKLGFEREGYAKSYLKIAGKWEDMVLNSKINSTDFTEPRTT